MPAWQDDLLDASIGGAPFFALSVRTSGGRRTVVTEFPDRDEAAAEDLGMQARRFAVEAIVLGDDYMRARDAVVDVLESKGPHRLRHPWYGEVNVVLDTGSKIEVSESAAEGGAARITFALVEVGTDLAFRIVPSPAAALGASSGAVKAAAAADFAATIGALDGVAAAVAAAIGKATAAMTKVQRRTLAALGGADTLAYALLDLDEARDDLAALPDALMSQINKVLGAIAALINDAEAADADTWPGAEKVLRVDLALQAATELHAVDVVTPPDFEGDAVDEEAQAAEVAFNLAFRATSAAIFSDLFQQLPLESADQAGTVLSTLGAALEDLLLEETLTDEAYDAISDLRASLGERAAQAAQSLPSLTTYTPTSATPALLIAFWVHGDPGRDLEIVARNKIADPNFVPGVPLEVLYE